MCSNHRWNRNHREIKDSYDSLEVVLVLADDMYNVWSENDQCIYKLSHQQLREEEELGSEVQWEMQG